MPQAGVSRVAITPPPGLPLMGYPDIQAVEGAPVSQQAKAGYVPRSGMAVGTLHSLEAKVLLLAEHGQQHAIVSLDLPVVGNSLTTRVRELLSSMCASDDLSVALLASHTHSGPDLEGYWDPIHPSHLERVAVQIAEAVVAAEFDLEVVSVQGGEADISKCVINRVDPEGPVDPMSQFVAVRKHSGKLKALLIKIAAHPIAFGAENLHYTGDWPGRLTAAVEALYPGTLALFGNGAAGNINPVGFPFHGRENVSSQRRRRVLAGESTTTADARHADRLGAIMAAAVVDALENLPEMSAAGGSSMPLKMASRFAELPLRDAEQRDLFCAYMNVRAEHAARLATEDTIRAEVQVVRFGDLVIVALPGEPFVEFALDIQARLPTHQVIVFGYANSDPRYIPTDAAFDRCTYETFGTPVERGSEGALMAAVASCCADLGLVTS